jgi:hypothetical protein
MGGMKVLERHAVLSTVVLTQLSTKPCPRLPSAVHTSSPAQHLGTPAQECMLHDSLLWSLISSTHARTSSRNGGGLRQRLIRRSGVNDWASHASPSDAHGAVSWA